MDTAQKIVVASGIIGILLIVGILVYVLVTFGLPEMFVGGVIAVVPLKGYIAEECDSYYNCIDPAKFKGMMEIAKNDESVKAIIIRVDSGGGEVVASRDLMRIIKNTKKHKPVIAYINNVGASGAYYAASASDKIVANEFAFVGGIGVKMKIIHYKRLLDKLGINVTVIIKPDNKDFGSPYKENLTKEEMAIITNIIEKIYNTLIAEIAENRNLSEERVKEISEKQGIYLGIDAKENELIDYVGDMDDAINIASEKAGIKGNVIVRYMDTGRESIFERIAMKIGYGFAKALIEVKEQKVLAEQ